MAVITLTEYQTIALVTGNVEPVRVITLTGGIAGATGADGADGVVQSIVAGTNVTVDNTDPANPIINASGGGGGAVDSVFGRTGAVVAQSGDYSKADVGLSNVDNTSDVNKPVSTAQATADGVVLSSAQTYAADPVNIVQDSTHRFATDAEKASWDAKQSALGFTPENVANKQTDLTASATKYPTVDAVNTGLSGKENTITATTAADYYRGDKTFQTLNKSAVGLSNVDNTSDANKPVSSATQTALNAKLDSNVAIVGATKTKITYDADGLITAGADATTDDIADSANKRYVTDANLTVIGNTSGTNTGDQPSIVGITGTKAQFNTAVTDGDILFTDNTLITYPYTGLVSGILTGCLVTINADPAKFNISAGTYLIVDWTVPSSPVITPVTYAGSTANVVTGIASNTFTRLYLNAAGAIVQVPGGLDTPQVRRQYCQLQLIAHPNLSSISSVTTNHKHGYEITESLIDYIKLLPPVISGNAFSANGTNLNINKSSGVFSALWVNSTIDNQDPVNKTLSALTAATFTTAYQNGSGGTTFAAPTTSVPVLYYDDGTGTLAALSNNKYVNLYCYVFNTNQVTLVYGQTFYSSLAAAVAAVGSEVFVAPAALAQGGITTVISVKKGATALDNISNAAFTAYKLSGSTGGGGVVQSIVAGTNVTVDNTDPANPIVSAASGSGNSVTATLAFGGAFTDKAQTVVTGQTWVTAGSNISANVLTPSGVDPDEMYLLDIKPVISDLVNGVGFTVTLYSTPEAKGNYSVMCIGV